MNTAIFDRINRMGRIDKDTKKNGIWSVSVDPCIPGQSHDLPLRHAAIEFLQNLSSVYIRVIRTIRVPFSLA